MWHYSSLGRLAYRLLPLSAVLFWGTASVSGASPDAEKVEFARDILPILSGHCFTCHGPDAKERKAELRLDLRDEALKPAESGERAIVPGQPSKSELVRRIVSDSRDEVMPPPGTGKLLKPREIELLKRWVEQGAAYEPHWSFVPPVRPARPAVAKANWPRNAVDYFILAGIEKAGLQPASEADRATLARRAALDLLGLPPTLEMADHFINDPAPDAYERYVDRLLAHPAFGERWAQAWLDLARYADSNGYANDNPRTIWRYRDWVIGAYNRNLPYDRFTIEQIAGDLLPNATPDQVLATAFNRNTLTNDEGGTSDEEFRVAAVVDRVNTTLQAWMGLSMQCAQCHTHKYDPITQEEYFRVYAIFNQTEDADRGDNSPLLTTPLPQEELRRVQLTAEIEALEKAVAEQLARKNSESGAGGGAAPARDAEAPLLARYVRVENLVQDGFLHLAEVEVFAEGKNVAPAGKASQISTDFGGPPERANDGNTTGIYTANSVSHTAQATNPWWEIDLGKAYAIERVVVWNRTDAGTEDRLKTWRTVGFDEKRTPVWIKLQQAPPKPSAELKLPSKAAALSAGERGELEKYAAGNAPPSAEAKKIEALKRELAGLKGVATPVMRELPADKRRTTRILIRGNFMDYGDEVQPGLLKSFHQLPAETVPDRRALALWLVDRANPLTARVAVDRFWDRVFGQGLVETPEDFGVRGKPPVQRALLDYLAIEFQEQGWNVKQLLRLLVTSATYRQSSQASPELVARDPENQLYARAARFRSSAETIRDQSLFAAGLLREKIYGPSVRPERPKMRLAAAFGGATDWETSPGEDRYRRALYTEWRRTAPYPSMVTFDASNRTVCTIRRPRTNTPLQALVTLNDPCYVEAAQALARRMLREGGTTTAERVEYGFRLCATRRPSAAEIARLVALYEQSLQSFGGNPTGANTLATKPLGPLPEGINALEAAAWTVVGNVLLNLDEVVAKR